MYRLTWCAFAGLLVFIGITGARAESGRIYGRITTVDNEVFEGWIRWDKNEAYWDDILDGIVEKERRDKPGRTGRRYKESRRNYTFDLFGLKVGEGSSYFGASSESQLQFGHIKTLTPDGDGAVILLKSGQEVVMESGSDIGPGLREILISDPKEGEIFFDWDDIDNVEFLEERSEPTDGFERLYGRVSTRRAGEFTGWVEWDVDEVFNKDDLDGDEDGGRNRKFKFERITSIERNSSSSARILLRDGKEIVLRNSNDVNSENRGIVVKSAELGRVRVDWADFEKVDFLPAPKSELPRYRSFDGGYKVQGTVTTEDGEEFSGEIAWDNDEEYSWEHINGEYKGVEMTIPFSAVASIEKNSQRSSAVTLKNGNTYLLSDSNDVDETNKGVFVIRDKKTAEAIDWYDFAKLVMK